MSNSVQVGEIVLVEPSSDYAEDIWNLYKEIEVCDAGDGDQFSGCMFLNDCQSAEEWIGKCARMKEVETYRMEGAPVPTHIYLAVRTADNRIVGSIELRHHIECPHLKLWGGHIGYSVRPSERKKGYGKEMLRLNLQKAFEFGIPKVLVTCADGNIASEKTIVANGGVYEKTVYVEGHGIKRFWVNTVGNAWERYKK